jgi:hypothetical protein
MREEYTYQKYLTIYDNNIKIIIGNDNYFPEWFYFN